MPGFNPRPLLSLRVGCVHRIGRKISTAAQGLDQFIATTTHNQLYLEIHTYEIEVMPCAYRFKAGHRIRLEIVNGDSPLTDSLFTHQYLYYKVGTDTFWHNAKNPSRLKLPVVPAK